MSLTRKKGRLVTKGFFCYMTFYGKFCVLISSLILYVTKEPIVHFFILFFVW